MTDSKLLAVVLRDEIVELLAPLTVAARHPAGVRMLLQSIGRAGELGEHAALRTELERLAGLAEQLQGLDTGALASWDGLADVLALAREVLAAVRGIENAIGDPALAEQAQSLGVDLVQQLVALHLRTRHMHLFRVASLLTLITPAELAAPSPMLLADGRIVRYARHADRFHPERVEELVKRPLELLAAHYFPNRLAAAQDAHAAGGRLFPGLALLAQALGLAWFSELVPAAPRLEQPAPTEISEADHFGDQEPGEGQETPVLLEPEPEDLTAYYQAFLPRFVFVLPGREVDGVPAPAQFALAALLSSAVHPGGLRGLVLAPLGQLSWSEPRGDWRISLASSGQVPAVVMGPDGVSRATSESPLAAASTRFTVERSAADGSAALVVGAADGTRLEVGTLLFSTHVQVDPDAAAAGVAAEARSGRLVLHGGDGDGFLAAILPSSGLQLSFALGLELSSVHGLRFKGAAGLDATLPLGLSLGGVKVPALHLGLRAGEAGLELEVSASVEASIGPVRTLIDRVGIAADLTFPDSGGNLGIGDLAVGFKPPLGAGLAIDASVVSGSGFLSFDAQHGQYAGVMSLSLEGGISLTAIGLIATRVPGGGFSLLVLITAEDFKPISLGMGFTLTGIGGLLALNRTFDQAALRAGLRNHTLDSVLFPRDPLRNAPEILSNLNRVFPVAGGHHLFGPMLRLAWGTPTLITADLGVVLEFGARRRLLIVGQLAAILPRLDHDLLRLQLDAVGVIDFDQGSAELDATLYDSRLLKRFVLTGDMALRLNWKGAPSFALAVGGLHPAFNPPANFPRLERIVLELAAGDNPRLRCEAYFAVTSNTVQFGARAELYAAAAGFSLHGAVGFDVLIQLDPFAFLAEFMAQVQLKRGSRNLFKVRVEGALAGPRPLHVKGKATFEILWWDVSVRFDKTLAGGETPPGPEPVDVLARLQAALAEPTSWTARLPEGQRPLVTLRETAASDGVLLHPLGSLTVKQGVVPLDLEIARFGSSTPAGARRFTISGASLGGRAQGTRPVNDLFAPAQFLELSDDQKLSRPSFESHAAGVGFGFDEFAFNTADGLEVEAIRFETITIDSETDLAQHGDPEQRYTLSVELLGKQARFGAAGSSELRRAGNARYHTRRVAYSMANEGWSVVATGDLSLQPLPGNQDAAPTSYSRAAQALAALAQRDPARAAELQILRLSELGVTR